MKKFINFSILAILTFCFQTVSFAYHEDQGPTIAVTGEAEVKVDPNEVTYNFGVETITETMQASKADNDRITQNVITALKSLKIPGDDIQASQINVSKYFEERYDAQNKRYRTPTFTIRRSIIITLKDLSLFENVITRALDAGVTHVNGINFRTTELKKYREEAREIAIKAAQEKAEKLSAALGQKVGKATSINSYQSGSYSWYNNLWYGWNNASSTGSQYSVQYNTGTAPTDSGISLGKISITASVSVSFELLEK
ncbi:MAG: hypothetical protein A2Z88_08580 [Omnitrophica WOR_2 bacterium GWA2_47_8]|nr:MAG: hypothetical protein A2Z88_08580 [Omnitrophica WOR_2 bacterium GWA2_47_8]